METYLFKFSACLVVFWLVYILFLERQTMHRFKRFYLLITIGSALLIPTLTLTEYVEPTPSDFEVSTVYVPFQPSLIEQPKVQAPFFDLETVLWVLYGLGVFIFAVRFLVNLFKMYKRISAHEKIEKRSFIYVLLEDCRIPHSFFKYLFFERTKYETDTIPDEVKLHEETHARQLHSLDIMAIELLQIVFWFHPLIYILKHHIKLNHEFLADQAVLDEGIDTKAYQKLLLQFSSNAHEYQLSSTINYSSIKKRFTVMKTQTSKTRMWWSSLLLLPIIAILFYSFAEKEYVEKENSKISEAIASELEKANDVQLIYKDGATEAMMKEYNDWIMHFNRTRHINNSTYQRIVAIYDLMTDTQKNTVEPYPTLPNIDLTRVEPKSPTEVQFDSWKEEKIFALWLDGNPIPNSELNNFTADDIVYFTGSKVLNNAMSESYPQPFQFNLYTKTGFTKTYQESGINDYRNITKTYALEIKDYLNGPQIDNSELKILKIKADRLYNQFTKADITKYNILPAPPVPAQKIPKTILSIFINQEGILLINNELGNLEALEKVLKNLRVPKNYSINLETDKQSAPEMTKNVLSLINKYGLLHKSNQIELPKRQQKLPTEKEIEAYNVWAKKIHAESKVLSKNARWFPPINEEDFINFTEIYKRMSPSQKNQSIEYPFPGRLDVNDSEQSFPSDTPTQQEKATAKQVASYNTWAKAINEQMAKAEANNDVNAYPIIKVKEVNTYKAIYDIMSDAQKKVSEQWPSFPPPPPRPPATKQTKGGPIEINGTTYYFTQQNGKTTYYDNYGKVVDINKIPPPPPIPNNATPEQKAKMKKATEAYMKANPEKVGKAIDENGETIEVIEIPEDLQGSVVINGETLYYTTSYGKTTYYNGSGKEVKMDNLPPPPPTKNPSFLEFIIEMKNEGAAFFLDGKKISAEQATTIAKNSSGQNIEMTTQKDENGTYIVKLSKQIKD